MDFVLAGLFLTMLVAAQALSWYLGYQEGLQAMREEFRKQRFKEWQRRITDDNPKT